MIPDRHPYEHADPAGAHSYPVRDRRQANRALAATARRTRAQLRHGKPPSWQYWRGRPEALSLRGRVKKAGLLLGSLIVAGVVLAGCGVLGVLILEAAS